MGDRVVMWGDEESSPFTKSHYWDPVAMTTAKRVRVCHQDATIIFRMNDVGFRSLQNRDGSRPLVVVWGDSVVFGQGRRTWVDMLEKFCPALQFFNGGVEGIEFGKLVDLMERRNAEVEITHNITMPGWHGWRGREADRKLWQRVAKLPGPSFVTMPSLLNEKTIEEDWSKYILGKNGGDWNAPASAGLEGCLRRFWGDDDFRATAPRHLDKIIARNGAIWAASRELNVSVCDMWGGMYFSTLAAGVPYYQDIGHPEPDTYPWMAEILWRSLKHEMEPG